MRDLVTAQQDPTITRYRREVTPYLFGDDVRVVDSVDVMLAPGGFDEVVAAVEEYRDAEDIDQTTVRSHGIRLTMDDSVTPAELTEARLLMMREVDEWFGLRAASIAYPNSMTFWVDAVDVPAVRQLVEVHDFGWAYADAQAHHR